MSGISGVGGQSALAIQQLVDMRNQFDDLQRQLATGQKSNTYAGLGINRGITVTLNAQWQNEKAAVNAVSVVQAQLEQAKTELETAQRRGNLTQAAEIQYGKIPELEKKLAKIEGKAGAVSKESGGGRPAEP